MLVKIPKIIITNDKQYKLYLEYCEDSNETWTWEATYLNGTGILYKSKKFPRLHDVESCVMEYITQNKYETL